MLIPVCVLLIVQLKHLRDGKFRESATNTEVSLGSKVEKIVELKQKYLIRHVQALLDCYEVSHFMLYKGFGGSNFVLKMCFF